MKSIFKITGIVLLIYCSTIELSAQKKYKTSFEDAKEFTYKSIDDLNLKLWVFNPPGHNAKDKKPAIVFFFGGGWNAGTPGQFEPHCEYLAARGMIPILVDYRVYTRHKVLASKCISDAKSAIRWVREHAGELGVDPDRIAAGGGSAGGHLAAATAVLNKFDEPIENGNISSKPNALVLFNPALVLAPANFDSDDMQLKEKLNNMGQRFGADPLDISPYHNLKSGAPPTIIFHGTDDTTVPISTIQIYCDKMKELGNKCKLVAYKGEPHGFFNFGKKANGPFVDTVNKMDKFLVSIGYLKAPPESKIK